MMGLALFYTLNNHLAIYLIVAVDLGTINLVKSFSSVVTALILWRFADRKIVRVQWFAVTFQMFWSIESQVCSLLLTMFSMVTLPDLLFILLRCIC
jgi:hypothetical protein